jgi:hypothetical protein
MQRRSRKGGQVLRSYVITAAEMCPDDCHIVRVVAHRLRRRWDRTWTVEHVRRRHERGDAFYTRNSWGALTQVKATDCPECGRPTIVGDSHLTLPPIF